MHSKLGEIRQTRKKNKGEDGGRNRERKVEERSGKKEEEEESFHKIMQYSLSHANHSLVTSYFKAN